MEDALIPAQFGQLGFRLGTLTGESIAASRLKMFDQALVDLHKEMLLSGPKPPAAAVLTLMRFIEGFTKAIDTRAANDEAKKT